MLQSSDSSDLDTFRAIKYGAYLTHDILPLSCYTFGLAQYGLTLFGLSYGPKHVCSSKAFIQGYNANQLSSNYNDVCKFGLFQELQSLQRHFPEGWRVFNHCFSTTFHRFCHTHDLEVSGYLPQKPHRFSRLPAPTIIPVICLPPVSGLKLRKG